MRTTIAQAKANRIARQAARRAAVATRKAAKAAHRAERHTVASHLRTMGIDETTANGMASTLRRKVTTAGVKGFALKAGTRRACTRYTRTQILTALEAYKPRKEAFKVARTQLLALAA